MPLSDSTDNAGNWSVPDRDMPVRRPATTTEGTLLAAGYTVAGRGACPSCGRPVTSLQSPRSSTHVMTNQDGTLHTCRREAEEAIEPLPPVPTFEDQQRRLDELLGKGSPENLKDEGR